MFFWKIFFIAVFILIGASLSRTGAADENAGTVLIPFGDLIKQDKTLSGHSGGVNSVTFSPDGKTLTSGGWGPSVILWDVATGNRIKTLSGHSSSVTSVTFSSDGKTLASGSEDKTIILWNVATGNRIKTLSGHSGDVTSVTFSLDGKTIASVSRVRFPLVGNSIVILWDISIYKTWEDSNSLATAGLITERDDKIRKITSPKSEFESTREYEERMRAAEIEKERIKKVYEPRIKEAMDKAEAALKEKRAKLYPYSFNISISKYDADSEGFEAYILDNKIFIPMLREKAMEISKRKENFRIEGMLKYYDSEKAELVNAFLVDEQTNSRFAFGKQTDAVMTASAQKTPPDLKISSIALSEPSGNNILDADEIGKIKVVLKNNGKGAGFGVSLGLAPATVLPKGIRFSKKTYIGTINPDEEKTVEIEIAGGEEVQTSEVNMKATLTESNGFDSSPIILAFKTKELVPPLLQISKIDIQDSEGKRNIAKGKEVNLTLSIQNAGSGPARGVAAEIVSKSPDVKIFGDNKIIIGMLNPGESRKAVFNIAVTQRYNGLFFNYG